MKLTGSERLQGEGFVLRPMEESDAALIAAASRCDIPDWTFIPRDQDDAAAQSWIRQRLPARDRGDAVRFVIEVDGQAAGTVGAQHPYAHDRGVLETFYFILPEFRRRGLATASLRLINDWVREVTPELRRIQLHVVVGNAGSGIVAKRAGYLFEGIIANQIRAANGYGPRDAEVYGLRVDGGSSAPAAGVLA